MGGSGARDRLCETGIGILGEDRDDVNGGERGVRTGGDGLLSTPNVHYGFLLRELVRRDFRGRYAGSLFGAFWSFAQPLWLLLLYSFVFSTVMKVPLVGERSENFGIWLFCGLLPWMALHEGVTRSATVITDHASLVRKLRFPSEILVYSVVASALLHEAIAACLFGLVLLGLGEGAWRTLPWLLVALPLQVALTAGLGLVVASVNVLFRDVAEILAMLLTAWFFLTPIVYPLGLASASGGEGLAGLLLLNPLTSLVELYRLAFLGGSMEPALLAGVGRLAAVALVAGLAGVWLFRRLQSTFVDEV